MSATREIDLSQVPGFLDRVAALLANESFLPAMKACAESAKAATKQNFARGVAPDGTPWLPLKRPRPRGGAKPLRDTGILMASVTARGPGSFERNTDVAMEFGTNLDRATLHQFGGVVTPKKGRALAIPLTRQAVTAGSPRNMAGLSLVWPKGARAGWLQDGGTKRKAPTKHFLLVPSVTIPARPFLGWNDDMADEAAMIVADFTERRIGEL